MTHICRRKPQVSVETISINIRDANHCRGHETLTPGTESRSYLKENHRFPWRRYLSILKMRIIAEDMKLSRPEQNRDHISKKTIGKLLLHIVGNTASPHLHVIRGFSMRIAV